MESDRIEQLLREADGQARASPIDAADVARRVLGRARARRRRRTTVVGASVVLIAAMVRMYSTREPSRPQKMHAGVDDLTEIRREIELQEHLVERLVVAERIRRNQARLARFEPASDDPLERAASFVLFHADRVHRDAGNSQNVRRAYQQVIECFPGTISAEQARQRTDAMREEG
jgi:hypothetical protein